MSLSYYTQPAHHSDDAVLIQEVIYYCDSRLRVSLCALQNMNEYPDGQQIMQQRIEQELQFVLAYVGTAAAKNLEFDIPPLTRVLGSTIFLSSGRDDPDLLSLEIVDLLRGDVYPGHPAAPVTIYALEWWSTPEEDKVDLLSNRNIQDCLHYHYAKRIEEGRPAQQYLFGHSAYSSSPGQELLPAVANDDSIDVLPSSPDRLFSDSPLQHDPRSSSPDREIQTSELNSLTPGMLFAAPISQGHTSPHTSPPPLTPSPDRTFKTHSPVGLQYTDSFQHDAHIMSRTPSPDRNFSNSPTYSPALPHPGSSLTSPDRCFSDFSTLQTPSPNRSFKSMHSSRSPSPDRDFVNFPGVDHNGGRTPSPERVSPPINVACSPSPNRDFLEFHVNDSPAIPDEYDDDTDSIVFGIVDRPNGPYMEDTFANIPPSMLD